MTPPLDLAAIRARAAAATPGPWSPEIDTSDPHDHCSMVVVAESPIVATALFLTADDAAFIAAARTDVPALCDALDAARATIAAQAAEVERLRREAIDTVAGSLASLSVATAATQEMIDARALAADALRYGSEECERLRAIVEGRTEPPTDAEVDHLFAAGFDCLFAIECCEADGSTTTEWSLGMSPEMAKSWTHHEGSARPVRWWALRDGRPCAWPVTP